MNGRIDQQTPALERKSARKPEHQRRDSRPQKPVGQFPDKHLWQSWRLPEDRNIVVREKVVVQSKNQPNQRPTNYHRNPEPPMRLFRRSGSPSRRAAHVPMIVEKDAGG